MQRLRGLLALNLTGTLGFTTSGTGKGYDKDPTMESVNTTQTACTGYYCTNKGLEEPILNQKASTGIVITGGKDASANGLVFSADLVNGVTDGVGSGITVAYNGATGEGDGSVTKSMVTHDVNLGKVEGKDKVFDQNARPQKESQADTNLMGKGSAFNIGLTTDTMDINNATLVLNLVKATDEGTTVVGKSTANILPSMKTGEANSNLRVRGGSGMGLAASGQMSNETSLALAGIIKSGTDGYNVDSTGTIKTGRSNADVQRTSKSVTNVNLNGAMSGFGLGVGAALTVKEITAPTENMTLAATLGANLIPVKGIGSSRATSEATKRGRREKSETTTSSITGGLTLPLAVGGATTGFENTYAASGAASTLAGVSRSSAVGQMSTDRAMTNSNFVGLGIAGGIAKGGSMEAMSAAGGAGLGSAGNLGPAVFALAPPIPTNFAYASAGGSPCFAPQGILPFCFSGGRRSLLLLVA
ncbi:hypothetical protein A3770_14p72710 [Chloropicon primus]|uniref:Uncharacterized protein n=1 Tax=Chloropicon primus TaxID=1764295 RepID=A0A5B8MW29_9CHLO|nr:hypothetical protein A3770_14p72710 [Chloropicon primus]|eukprot:QDZ24753.1 hypothetical protein A3770_14p72710 [Chloropicon primus]